MLPHFASVTILALLAVETYRTVLRFGERRVGIGGQFVSKPGPHLLMAAVYAAFGFGLYPLEWWPVYFSVGLWILASVYTAFIFRWVTRDPNEER